MATLLRCKHCLGKYAIQADMYLPYCSLDCYDKDILDWSDYQTTTEEMTDDEVELRVFNQRNLPNE